MGEVEDGEHAFGIFSDVCKGEEDGEGKLPWRKLGMGDLRGIWRRRGAGKAEEMCGCLRIWWQL